MINILMLYKNFSIGGAENLILSLSEELDCKEYNISIAACFQNEIKSSEINIYHIRKSKFKVINYINYVKQIVDICKSNKIDIIHSHHRFTTMISLIVKKIINIEVIHTEHNVFPNKNFINLRGKNIVAVSKSVRDNMIKNNVNPSNIDTIYNGINKNKYINASKKNLKEELGIDENEFCFGFIGRLDKQKGIGYLLEAFNDLISQGYKAKLIIIGDGSMREDIIKYIEDNNLMETVYLVGFRSDIINIINSLDIYVLPSIYEGFPMINMEIMINKKILIATDVGGNKEIIQNETNGYIIKSRSVDELLNKMKHVLESKEELRDMGNLAKEIIINKFTTEVMCKEYSNYYKKILKSRCM